MPAKTGLLALAVLTLAGCTRPGPVVYQGYLEGEFVYLASPLAGRLDHLTVQKGARVTAGTPLFALEQDAERATLREATERARQSEARLADLLKGQRPTELAALEARLAQARSAADFSALELERSTKLHSTGMIPTEDYDRVRLNHASNLSAIAEASAELDTARLGGRADVVAAAEADAAATRAALDRAGWAVAQKNQSAPRDGLVYDTLYRQGEFVAAAAPVIVLLPPENIKVRFFVPELEFGKLKAGDVVQVAIAGHEHPLEARISYLSPQPEYTPPVLYNRENRSKLVFLVEALVAPTEARELHPGQPVEVTP